MNVEETRKVRKIVGSLRLRKLAARGFAVVLAGENNGDENNGDRRSPVQAEAEKAAAAEKAAEAEKVAAKAKKKK